MKQVLFILVVFTAALCGCTKSSTSTTSVIEPGADAYSVDGIQDVILNSDIYTHGGAVQMPVTITYHDSAQLAVTVTMTGVPNGVTWGTITPTSSGYDIYSTGPWTGIPTFTLLFSFAASTSGYTPGTYPITLTCVNSSGNTKIFTFNLIIEPG